MDRKDQLDMVKTDKEQAMDKLNRSKTFQGDMEINYFVPSEKKQRSQYKKRVWNSPLPAIATQKSKRLALVMEDIKKTQLEADFDDHADFYDFIDKFRSWKPSKSFPKEKSYPEEWEILHRLIMENNLKEVRKLCETYPAKFYLNSKNESALFTAAKFKKFYIYSYLKSIGAEFWNDEENKVITQLSEEDKAALIGVFVNDFSYTPKPHIAYLLSKTRSQKPIINFGEKLNNYYRNLDEIPEISSVLKVVQYADWLDVLFDYDSSEISSISPIITTTRTFYQTGRIYIAASPKRRERELLGTIAHELTHLAMDIIFSNDCNPFDKNDILSKNHLENIKKNIVKNFKRISPVLKDLGKDYYSPQEFLIDSIQNYREEDHISELIVKVPQMLVQYENGREWLEENASELLQFYHEKIIPKCEEFVEMQSKIDSKNIIRRVNESLGEIIKLKKCRVFFKNSNNVKEICNEENKKIFLFQSEYTLLGTIKTLQGFFGKNYIIFSDKFLVFSLGNFLMDPFSNTEALYFGHCDILIIIFEEQNTNDEAKRFFDIITELVAHKFNKKIILIMRPMTRANVYDLNIIETKFTEMCKEVFLNNFSLSDLTHESQTEILSKNIIFQKCKMKLADLIGTDEEMYKFVDGDVIEKILKDEQVYIGNEFHGHFEDCFIDIYEEISLETFKSELKNSKDMFFVIRAARTEQIERIFGKLPNIVFPESHATTEKRNLKYTLHKNLILADDFSDEDFKKLCRDKIQKQVYFIEASKGESNSLLMLIKIYNPKFYIGRRFNQIRSVKCLPCVDEKQLIEELDGKKVFIIADSPGMGKSTTLNRLMNSDKIADNHWIIKINLRRNFINHLNRFGSVINLNHLIQCLQTIQPQLKTPLISALLERALNPDKRFQKSILLIFDNFDAVSDENDRIAAFLKYIKTETKSKIWIATGLLHKEKLENELETFATSFLPLNDQTKQNFIKNFFQVRLKLTFDLHQNSVLFDNNETIPKIWVYADNFLKKSAGESHEKSIDSILNLCLLLENSLLYFKKWPLEVDIADTTSKGYYLPDNLFDIYEKFVKTKYEIYFKKMSAKGEKNEKHIKNLEEQHEDLAALLIKNEFFYDVKTKMINLLPVGLTKLEDGNNHIGFIHGIFRDFFAAKYFIKILYQAEQQSDRTQNYKENINLILSEILLNSNYIWIRHFMNILIRQINEIKLPKQTRQAIGEILMPFGKGRFFLRRKSLENGEKKEYEKKKKNWENAFDLAIAENNIKIAQILLTNKPYQKFDLN